MKSQVSMKHQEEVKFSKEGIKFMKCYQVINFGKPLALRVYENPIPKGKEILIKILTIALF